MTRRSFVLRMAVRESRGARRRLAFLTGAITIGVAALVAINAFTENLRTSVADQARALLGADLSFASRAPLPDPVRALIDTLVTPSEPERAPGASASVVSFSGMAYVTRTTGARLVQVQAVDSGYPYYGVYRTEPAGEWARLQEGGGGRVLVDPSILNLFDAQVGDTLALGNARFVIAGTVVEAPGNVGFASAFGPPIWIASRDLEATGLLRFGARAEYETYLRLPAGREAEKIAGTYRPILRPDRVRIRTVDDDRADLSDNLTRMGNYLGLVALIALLLGGLGVASAVHVFIQQRLDTIGILRCLGATARDVFAIYLLQAAVMGLIGSVLGAALGVGIQQLLPSVLGSLLPLDVQVAFAPRAVFLGLGIGLWIAVIFAVLPLAAVRRISPLVTLRRDVDPAPRRRDSTRWIPRLLLVATVAGLAVLQASSPREGLAFAGGIGVVLLILALTARALTWGVRRWFPSRWPYLIRQGLANLYRPANQTVTVVLALGFGAFLLSTLYLIQHNLLRELRVDTGELRPNIAFYDIQVDQREGVVTLLRDAQIETSPVVPIVPMRIRRVVASDTTRRTAPPPPAPARRRTRGSSAPAPTDSASSGRDTWAFRREYRSTYRDSLVATEQMIQGTWWTAPADTSSLRGTKTPKVGAAERPVPISVEAGLATELGITVGDRILWDVQGIEIWSQVANLREVNWARLEPNFFVVFGPGALERAPQMMATLARIEDPAERGRIQRALAESYPNVTSLDLSIVQNAIQGIVDRVAFAIRFMAAFSLLTGAVVLIGAVSTNRFQRIREAVLLKTLGATRRQVLRIIFVEYVALGALAVLISVVLAAGAGWALARYLFETAFAFPAGALLGVAGALVAVTLGVGLWGSAEILKRTPLEVLRTE